MLSSSSLLLSSSSNKYIGSPSYQELNMDKGFGVGLLNHHDIMNIASTHNKTSAQVLLRWNLQRNVIVIPKSTKMERIIENAAIFDFELTEEEVSYEDM